jgi:hypothetical protein
MKKFLKVILIILAAVVIFGAGAFAGSRFNRLGQGAAAFQVPQQQFQQGQPRGFQYGPGNQQVPGQNPRQNDRSFGPQGRGMRMQPAPRGNNIPFGPGRMMSGGRMGFMAIPLLLGGGLFGLAVLGLAVWGVVALVRGGKKQPAPAAAVVTPPPAVSAEPAVEESIPSPLEPIPPSGNETESGKTDL